MGAQDHATPPPNRLVDHHEEPQSPPQSGMSIIIKCTVAVALGIFVYLLPTPDNLSPEGHRLLALLVTILVLWTTEALPIGVTALCVGGGMIAFDIVGRNDAWTPYANPAVMFVLMIIMFGVILNEVGLARRLMYYLLKFAGTNVKKLSFILAVGCTLTATVLHDATVTVIMVFAFVPVFMAMGMKPGSGHKLPKFFLMLIPMAASAGGFGTMIGGGRNPLALEVLYRYTEETTGVGKVIGFMEYLIIQMPISIFTAIATWAVVYFLFRPEEKELKGIELDDPGPMSTAELGVSIVFVLTFILWFLGDFTGWHVSVAACIAMVGFCGPGWVSFKTVCDKFPWESWIVFGAGVSLGMAMLQTGAGQFLAESLLPMLEGKSSFTIFYGLGLFGSFLSSLMSNSAAVALTLPITLPMADMLNMSPVAVALLAPVTTSFIMLVIGCPPTIIAYSAGYFTQIDFIKVAVPWCLILLLVSVAAALLYWPLIGIH
ncbi:sodium-dependent dicarboxylate transporter 2/3/5 [Desulfobotulus alkaliphilus]|uniref:Sodium-dependent dicarboxylate transporter 2/3/5 n=1 Tax=Desulfobotulus alkaliphilus TaxID=622671 RepID=A0A562RYI0_9BACT|nr:DASS family sodium-coupled anion symporter [Desulfobotulus alkaliphilus]TWI74149.1 sodium-dependent dicarboxylate transporter 2/3/5 [Desulfobotulus alkaliphilus]